MKKWICALAAIALIAGAFAYAQELEGEETVITGTVISVNYEEIVLANVRKVEDGDGEEHRERNYSHYLNGMGASRFSQTPGYGGGYGYYGFPGYDDYGFVNPWDLFDWFYGNYGGFGDYGGNSQETAALKVTEDTEAYRMEDGEQIPITLNEIQAGDSVTVTYRDDTALTVIAEETSAYISQPDSDQEDSNNRM